MAELDLLSRRSILRLAGAAALARFSPAMSAGPSRLRTRPIPSSGEEIPVVGLGTWQTFDVGGSMAARAPLEEVLSAFVESGARLVDSSPMYGRSEEVVGDIASRRGISRSLFLATKVWTAGREAGIAQMERSMRLLGADRLDLMQVHNLVDVETHLKTLRQWKESSKIRYLGITHYSADAYPAVARLLKSEKLDFLQINYSLLEREAERELLPLAAERGVAVIANRPFAGGELFRRVRGKTVPGWAAELDCGSWAQFFLKWILGHPAVTCAIPATDDARHLRDDLQAGLGRLPDDRTRRRMGELLSGS